MISRDTAVLVAALALVLAPPALAQVPSGHRMYAALGRTGSDQELDMTTVEVRWGSVAPLKPGVDFAIPIALGEAGFAASDVDLALPIPVGQGTRVIPRAGGFLMIGVGRSSDAFALGWNAGAGLVFNSEGPVLLRADYTLRSFMNPDGGLDNAMQAVSAGVGWKF